MFKSIIIILVSEGDSGKWTSLLATDWEEEHAGLFLFYNCHETSRKIINILPLHWSKQGFPIVFKNIFLPFYWFNKSSYFQNY